MSRVVAMRATCSVMSGRTPSINCDTGSIIRKVCEDVASPLPETKLSSNSIKGGLTRS